MLAKDQHKEIFQTSKPVKDNKDVGIVNDSESEDKNDAAKVFIKPKQKVVYEIVEEIVESTEITYKLIHNRDLMINV